MSYDRKKYAVKHYFVLARIIKKDGTLSRSFKTFDYLDKKEAMAQLNKLNANAEFSTLPFALIEYTAMQQKLRLELAEDKAVEVFETIWVAPKCVREAYNQSLGV